VYEGRGLQHYRRRPQQEGAAYPLKKEHSRLAHHSQHFLLSRPAKTLSLVHVFRMSDAETEAHARAKKLTGAQAQHVYPYPKIKQNAVNTIPMSIQYPPIILRLCENQRLHFAGRRT
jgi:hypothetical protein